MVPRDTGMAIVTKSPTRHLVVGTAAIACDSIVMEEIRIRLNVVGMAVIARSTKQSSQILQKNQTSRMARVPSAAAPTKIITAASAARTNVQRNMTMLNRKKPALKLKTTASKRSVGLIMAEIPAMTLCGSNYEF